MARMSIDDKLLRDPRVLRLARALGWSRRETVGALLDVFAVAYDRERDVLPSADIDIAAEREGFADLMFEVDLAEQVRGRVRIKGAKERIEYLVSKSNAGRIGGIKSGESRRKSAKQKTNDREARRNPPDPVPDLPPDPVPDQISDPPPARDPAVPDPVPHSAPPSVPAVSQPAPERGDIAGTQQPMQPRGEAPMLWRELELARTRAGKKLGLEILPLPVGDRGERDLADLFAAARSRGPDAVETLVRQVRHAIAMAASETIAGERDPEWFTGAVFSPNNFRRLVAKQPAKPAAPTPARPRRKPTLPPAVVVSEAERAEVAAIAAEARARLFGLGDGARAPPASARPSDEKQQPQRKAAT